MFSVLLRLCMVMAPLPNTATAVSETPGITTGTENGKFSAQVCSVSEKPKTSHPFVEMGGNFLLLTRHCLLYQDNSLKRSIIRSIELRAGTNLFIYSLQHDHIGLCVQQGYQSRYFLSRD